MTITAVTPEIVTLTEAKEYLRDQGVRDGHLDHLQRLLNGVTGEVYEITGRKRILDDDSSITEYRDGDGTNELWTKEYPITYLAAITLYPHETNPDIIVGPLTDPANDDVIVDMPNGKVQLRYEEFPDGFQTAVVSYKAGHSATSSEIQGLKMVMLEQLQVRWQRFIEKSGLISTREADDHRWTFKKDAEIQRAWVRALQPWRRMHW